MQTIIIAAMACNRVIGSGNAIPWHIPEEIHHFKKTTTDHAVIMGRKTFESIGSPLPQRFNVVLSRQKEACFQGCRTASSLNQALQYCSEHEKTFIIGGESIYRESMWVADTILLSILDQVYDGDILFPPIPPHFTLVSEQRMHCDQPFSILCYQHQERQ